MRRLAGWQGAGLLVSLAAIAIALAWFRPGNPATLDWSFPFITIVFVVLPILSLLNIALTLLLVRRLSWRGRVIELASVVVPGAILAAARDGYYSVLRLFLESN